MDVVLDDEPVRGGREEGLGQESEDVVASEGEVEALSDGSGDLVRKRSEEREGKRTDFNHGFRGALAHEDLARRFLVLK